MDNAIQITLNKKNIAYSKSNIKIVLIIGESFNKYHSSLYGYRLNTNPNLMKEYHSIFHRPSLVR